MRKREPPAAAGAGGPDADGRPPPTTTTTKADYTLRIAPVTVELAPDHILSTIGYNDSSPGPVLRMREGKTVSVDVINDTDVPELVHWHGMLIPSEVDGVEEQGTPPVPARGRRRYQLTPRPAGSRWYHSHAMAEADLHRGSYTGQFGFVYVDGAKTRGNMTRRFFSPCATGNLSLPAIWMTMMMTAMPDRSPRSQRS